MDTRLPTHDNPVAATSEDDDLLTLFDSRELEPDERRRANWFLLGFFVAAILFDVLLGFLVWSLIA